MLKGTAHPGGVQSNIPQISVEAAPLLHDLLEGRSQSFDLGRLPEERLDHSRCNSGSLTVFQCSLRHGFCICRNKTCLF